MKKDFEMDDAEHDVGSRDRREDQVPTILPQNKIYDFPPIDSNLSQFDGARLGKLWMDRQNTKQSSKNVWNRSMASSSISRHQISPEARASLSILARAHETEDLTLSKANNYSSPLVNLQRQKDFKNAETNRYSPTENKAFSAEFNDDVKTDRLIKYQSNQLTDVFTASSEDDLFYRDSQLVKKSPQSDKSYLTLMSAFEVTKRSHLHHTMKEKASENTSNLDLDDTLKRNIIYDLDGSESNSISIESITSEHNYLHNLGRIVGAESDETPSLSSTTPSLERFLSHLDVEMSKDEQFRSDEIGAERFEILSSKKFQAKMILGLVCIVFAVMALIDSRVNNYFRNLSSTKEYMHLVISPDLDFVWKLSEEYLSEIQQSGKLVASQMKNDASVLMSKTAIQWSIVCEGMKTFANGVSGMKAFFRKAELTKVDTCPDMLHSNRSWISTFYRDMETMNRNDREIDETEIEIEVCPYDFLHLIQMNIKDHKDENSSLVMEKEFATSRVSNIATNVTESRNSRVRTFWAARTPGEYLSKKSTKIRENETKNEKEGVDMFMQKKSHEFWSRLDELAGDEDEEQPLMNMAADLLKIFTKKKKSMSRKKKVN